ncbi:MAG: LptA/OstA family protein [Candidatus Omnitrophota bacterium]|nr:LptA/OstA family protein [Candidatus Omnitrophota bacterium]
MINKKIFALLLSSVVFFSISCGKKEAPKKITTVKPADAARLDAQDQIKHKVMSFDLEGLGDNGKKKWGVKGQSAEAISEHEVKLDSIVASAYGEDSLATITADKGVYDKTKNNVRLEQNVKATIEDTRGKSGDFMDFSNVLGSGSSEKRPAADKSKKTKTLIVCDGEVEFDYEKNQAYFNKNVKVTNDEGNIEADKITINLDPLTKRIGQIVCEGNVKITRGANITYSDKATYFESEKKILLTGAPKLVIYQEGSLEDNMFGKK